MKGVSLEICVQDNNAHKTKTRQNAEKLVAAVCLAKSLTLIEKHGDCCRRLGNPAGCHDRCPESINKDGYWPTFTTNVTAIMNGSGPAPTPMPTYANPIPPPAWDGDDKQIGTVTFHALQRNFRAAVERVPVLQYADLASSPVREPLPKGEVFVAWYMVDGADGKPWLVTKYGSRIPAEMCTPLFRLETP